VVRGEFCVAVLIYPEKAPEVIAISLPLTD
jgi:hypothetical protein